ncbi:acyl carrier protein [Pendulispora brunnea]|uniref:Acyl carrier protein n=1 Tax=Pendulispora brunnea TaxID=2905690 RepID=A0ABZ2KL89_9BACT
MIDERIYERVYDFIVENYLGGEGEELDHDTPLLKLGILDSMRMIELLTFLETECGVFVHGRDILAANFKTLKNIADLAVRIRDTSDGLGRAP